MSLSHISLMVHPAPRMTRAPAANIASVSSGGRTPGAAARAMLQPHGQNSSQDPAQQSHHPITLSIFYNTVKHNILDQSHYNLQPIFWTYNLYPKHFLYNVLAGNNNKQTKTNKKQKRFHSFYNVIAKVYEIQIERMLTKNIKHYCKVLRDKSIIRLTW